MLRRIFLKNLQNSSTVSLDKENQNYLKNVLRLKKGAEILAFNGEIEVLAIFQQDHIEIKEITRTKEETNLKLAIASIKQSRLEIAIEKATELGVSEIYLFESEFSQHKIRSLSRLQKILIEAARQCNRVSLPKISQSSLPLILKFDFKWAYGSLNEENQTAEKGTEKALGIIIGPEGGFSEKELEFLSKHCTPINLGKNILRSETAAIAGLVALSYESI